VDRNKRLGLGHYTSISLQHMPEQQYESISGIPIQRTEIQTAKSTTSVDVSLTVVSFSTTAYKNI